MKFPPWWGYGYVLELHNAERERQEKQHFKYAKQMKRHLSSNPNFWKEDIVFYLDGVSFVYKRNPLNNSASPKARVWRKQGEGLQITAKGWWTMTLLTSGNCSMAKA